MRARRAGSIVNVSSGTTLADAPGTGAYVASKIGLERLSAIARAELEGSGVTVSTVIPFATRTEFVDSLRAGSDEARAGMAGVDFDAPEQVAEGVLDLVSRGRPEQTWCRPPMEAVAHEGASAWAGWPRSTSPTTSK